MFQVDTTFLEFLWSIVWMAPEVHEVGPFYTECWTAGSLQCSHR